MLREGIRARAFLRWACIQVCDCVLRDHQNFLLHINGRKHNRMLGMTMRAERSTVEEVHLRLALGIHHIPFAFFILR